MATTIKNVLGTLLLALLLPLWMVLGLAFVAIVVARQLYWWGRGNTTVTSRPASRVTSSPRVVSAPDARLDGKNDDRWIV